MDTKILQIDERGLQTAKDKLKQAADTFSPLLEYLRKIGFEPTPDEFRNMIYSPADVLKTFIRLKHASEDKRLKNLTDKMKLDYSEAPAEIIKPALDELERIKKKQHSIPLAMVYSFTFQSGQPLTITAEAEAQLEELHTIKGTERQLAALKKAEAILEDIKSWQNEFGLTFVQSFPSPDSIAVIQRHAEPSLNIHRIKTIK